MAEEPINVAVAESFLKQIMTRKRNRKIVNSQIILVEVEAPEEEEGKESVMNRHTRSNINATIASMAISVTNAIMDHRAK